MPPALRPTTSGNQLRAVSGREGRQTQAAIARALSPLAISRAQAEQESERIRLAEQQQRRQQGQQTAANVISGVGTLAQAGTELGLFGGGTTAATTGAATAGTTGAAAGGAAAGGAGAGVSAGTAGASGAAQVAGTEAAAAGAGAGAGGGSGAAGASGSVATGAAGGALGAAAAGTGAGAVGATAGQYYRKADAGRTANTAVGFGIAGPAIFALDEGTQQRLGGAAVGATVGAAGGFATGGVVGAAVGFVVGGIGGGLCAIVTACHGADSDEVRVARAYRDSKMSKATQRGYYILATAIAPRMEADPQYKALIRDTLVAPLIRYGRFVLGMPGNAPEPSPQDVTITHRFLDLCQALGEDVPNFTRDNGEVV